MTLTEVTSQVYGLALAGYINGEKFTKQRFEGMVKSLMREQKRYVFQIAMRDGWWWASITKYADRPDGFDYFIPDDREQEKAFTDTVDFLKGWAK